MDMYSNTLEEFKAELLKLNNKQLLDHFCKFMAISCGTGRIIVDEEEKYEMFKNMLLAAMGEKA